MPEDILSLIFTGIPYHELERRDLFFKCACGKERVERASLPLEEMNLQRLISRMKRPESPVNSAGRLPVYPKELEACNGRASALRNALLAFLRDNGIVSSIILRSAP